MSDAHDRLAGLDPTRLAQLAEANKVSSREADPAEREPDGPSFQPGHVLEAKTGGYLVLSRTAPGTWWLVHGRSCSCPAGRSGSERCWHRSQVQSFVAKLNEAMRRPTPPPNISALVD